MIRTCSDCPKQISKNSKGRCRKCANAERNGRPEMRAIAAESMRRKQADPNFPRGSNSVALKAHYQVPENRAGIRAAAAKGREARRIPDRHRDLHLELRARRHKVADIRRMIADLERAEARRVVQRNIDAMERKAAREKAQAY